MTKMFKASSVKNKKYRLVFLMLPVVIPGLIISGFGILTISQQEKAKVLKAEEKYTADLELIRQEVEEEIESTLERVFQQLLKNQIQLNYPGSIQQVLKEILLKNSIVKYPFLIDSRGKFIFPFSKKSIIPIVQPSFPGIGNKKIEFLYREGERFEFKERKITEALKHYVKCLEYGDEGPFRPYIFNSIARCYFKLARYPQAVSYYQSILELYSQVLSLKKDFSLYFQVLRQMAQSYQRLGWKERAVEMYLQLYDKILQYETANPADRFAFFKNEALEYLNQYINIHLRKPDLSGTADRLREFAGPDISLRWRYFEFDSSGNTDNETMVLDRENRDIYRFMKIREFYLYTDEKTQFYKTLKGMKQWQTIDPLTTGMEISRVRSPVSGDIFDVVVKRLPGGSPIFFGFMISPGFLSTNRVLGILNRGLEDPGLKVLVVLEKDRGRQFDENSVYRFPLLSVQFDRFFPGKILALYSRGSNYFPRQAREEIRLNYLLISSFILVLILGIYLFYKYLSREAELVRLKSEFTDRASHTLKTPLTRIRMLAEKLQLGWVTNESKKAEYLQAILSESDRMDEMITNMLDFSRIEAGRKQYNFENTSLPGVVKEVLESYTPYIKNLGFQLEVNIDNNIPCFLLDAEAVRLIVVNLVQNAVKYSIKEKFIIVRLYREKEAAVLEVEDKGMGIEKVDLEKIFERFHRASGGGVQTVEGSGLGLYLVQHAVRAHNGEVKVISHPGKGSRFVVLLPIKGILNKKLLRGVQGPRGAGSL
ncbi:MAG: tetratricopeptide repeat-containing sensor histidine kinase, partial [Candidatus Aminicenantes bacterium]